MKPCYIHNAIVISAQNTFDTDGFLDHIKSYNSNRMEALHPHYKDYISPIAARRMATGVKMGVTAAKKILSLVQVHQLDAIIVGTGMGCIEDTETFLNAILANEESFLTPTAFIQSTHNTVAAQIALNLACKGYNNTFVQGSASFESALLDTFLVLQNEANSVLLGGVDELGNEFIDYIQMMELKEPQGIQVPFGEGAQFFLVGSEKGKSHVMVKDIEIMNSCDIDIINKKLANFIEANGYGFSDIDAFVFGYNGDLYDRYYEQVVNDEVLQLSYKHLSGEYFTASAFGFWVAFEILRGQEIPEALIKKGTLKSSLKNIILYNQFKGQDHSFILLSRC